MWRRHDAQSDEQQGRPYGLEDTAENFFKTMFPIDAESKEINIELFRLGLRKNSKQRYGARSLHPFTYRLAKIRV